jgi:PQQ-dependent dehydrogenase (s-GDH family)
MKRQTLILIGLICILVTPAKTQKVMGPEGEIFSYRVVADKLSDAWEITYGPDHYLWVTEARGYRVSRINPLNGDKTVLLDLTSERKFPRYDRSLEGMLSGKTWPEGGLMGLALHPDLLTGKPWVYLAYLYRFSGADKKGNGCDANFGGCFYTTRIVRYTYDQNRQKLVDPVLVCDTIPGSNDHNGGRLMIAPVNGKPYLFYSIGDMGAGQFINGGRPNHAQQKDSYEGKILRFNTEPDADAGVFDRWIPNDNPFNGQRQNAVWTCGHRNPEGLAYAVVGGQGRIYSSEHGPCSDDEINLIEKGKNYGHPLVIGYADNDYNGLAAGVSNNSSLPGPWHTSYPLINSETDNVKLIGADNYRDPIKVFFPSSNEFLKPLFSKIRDEGWADWPAEAPSSIDVYTSDGIPGWKNSLLIPTLKGNTLIRLQLNAAGDKITGDSICYFTGIGRMRDVAVSPDGMRLYLAVDSTAGSSTPSQHFPGHGNYRGCILEFTYLGQEPN